MASLEIDNQTGQTIRIERIKLENTVGQCILRNTCWISNYRYVYNNYIQYNSHWCFTMWHTMWPDLSLLGKYINTEYNSIGDIRMTDIGGESKLIWNILKKSNQSL